MIKLAYELDKLAILVTVAEMGKINHAAEILNLSQPSVSRAIQKLEVAYGMAIFVRSRDGVKLTKAGSILYERASRILREIEDIQVRAKYIDEELSGLLTVGTYESMAEYLWPDFLLKLQATQPSLQLSVKTNLPQNSFIELEEGRIDFLVDAEPQIRASLVSWPLYYDKFSFFVADNFKMERLAPADAPSQNVIFVQNAFDENRLTIEDHLDREGYRFARRYCFDSFSTAKRLAIRGMGIAVLPLKLAKEDLKQRLIKPIHVQGFQADGFGRHSICATVAEENKKNFRVRKLISLLKEHFR